MVKSAIFSDGSLDESNEERRFMSTFENEAFISTDFQKIYIASEKKSKDYSVQSQRKVQ